MTFFLLIQITAVSFSSTFGKKSLFEKRFRSFQKSKLSKNMKTISDFNEGVFGRKKGMNYTLIPFSRSLQKTSVDPSLPRGIYSIKFPANTLRERIVFDVKENSMNALEFRTSDLPYTFVGFSPRLEELEIITWNQSKRRYDFFIIKNVGPKKRPKLVRPKRSLCISCHQNGGPIFTHAPWAETIFSDDIQNKIASAKLTKEEAARRSFFEIYSDTIGNLNDTGQLDDQIRTASTLQHMQSQTCENVCYSKACLEKLKQAEIQLKLNRPQFERYLYIRNLEKEIPGLKSLKYPTSVIPDRNPLRNKKALTSLDTFDVKSAIKERVDYNASPDFGMRTIYQDQVDDVKFVHSYEGLSGNFRHDIDNQGEFVYFKRKSRFHRKYDINDLDSVANPGGYRDLVYGQNLQQQVKLCVEILSRRKLPSHSNKDACVEKTVMTPKVANFTEFLNQSSKSISKSLDQKKLENQISQKVTLEFDQRRPQKIKKDILDKKKHFNNSTIEKLFDKGSFVGWRRDVFTTPSCTGSCRPINFALYFDKQGKFLYYETLNNKSFTKFDHAPFTRENHIFLLNKLRSKKTFEGARNNRDLILDKKVVDATTGATVKKYQKEVVRRGAYTTILVMNYKTETQKIIERISK